MKDELRLIDQMEQLVRLKQENEIQSILKKNDDTEKFGLVLSREDAEILAIGHQDSLREQRRVEFGQGVIEKIIFYFCDSSYLNQESYRDSLLELQEIFYLYKNETEDELTDEELLELMRDLFDTICFGSLEYLAETCLERFAQAVRNGYRGFIQTQGRGEQQTVSEEVRWDRELFLTTLKELF